MGRKNNLGIVAVGAAVVLVQMATRFTGTGFYLTQLTMSAYYSILIMGLCLLMGYAGQISLGHAGFFAIGGYFSAFLSTYNLIPHHNQAMVKYLSRLGLLSMRPGLYGGNLLLFKPWIAGLIAVASAVAIAFAIAGPILKLRGHYLAMATLGFGIIVFRMVLGSAIFGEADGLSDVPPLTLFPGFQIGGKLSMRVYNYYFAWGLVIVVLWALLNLVNSRIGKGLRSIHGAEDAAMAVGVDTAQLKLRTFVLSSGLAAVAGVFLTHYNGGIGPSEASVMKSVRYVAIVAVGGMANLWGALVMSMILNFLSLRGYFGSLDDAVFGIILILIMLFAPEGLLGINLRGAFEFIRKIIKKAVRRGPA